MAKEIPFATTDPDKLSHGRQIHINGGLDRTSSKSEIVVPSHPNLKAKKQLPFVDCTITPEAVEFQRFLRDCGILNMITDTFVRLEREKQRPADPWEWLRYRFFLQSFNPEDSENFHQILPELSSKRDKLIKERNILLRAKAKREETTAPSKV
jgi:hypothetical protein